MRKLLKIQHLIEFLCTPPIGAAGYSITEGFWNTLIGQVIRYVQLHQHGDNLIDYTTAAALLFPDEQIEQHAAVKRIVRLIESEKLVAYTDPRISNPKHAQRVSRQQVLALLQERPAQGEV